MNLWFRLVRVWLAARRRSPLGLEDVSVIRLRVWPNDLDLWGHVNGGRYLTMSDLGRLDLFVRAGFFQAARKEGWVLPIGGAAVRFRRPLRLLQRVELRTRVIGWDDRWGYLSTEFLRGGKVVATVVARGLAQDRSGTSVSMDAVFARLGWDSEPPRVSPAIRAWVEAEADATR
jgi:acyl-CoA thioesterase FadM